MLRFVLFFALFLSFGWSQCQQSTISGTLVDRLTGIPITNAEVLLEGEQGKTQSNSDGFFRITSKTLGEQVLTIAVAPYNTQKIVVIADGKTLALGKIYLEPDITLEKKDNLISLTDTDLSGDVETLASATGLLQATRDIFLSKAAFDFGQAFFRVRGYDSREGRVHINGILMNKFFDGRPQWNNWGGLNDVTRNQEFNNALQRASFTYGGILGNTNINMRPSSFRPGMRLSSSFSNRTYAGRVMASYTSKTAKNKLVYTFSGSRRWAKEGFIAGTLYDAFSFFGAVEYAINSKNTFTATAILAKNRRGRSSAITEEVFELTGAAYNPYWGLQEGTIRNARERTIFEPVFIGNHYYTSKNLRLTTGLAYQTGKRNRSRLGYFNAPNPDPTYFRYLPSFYINNPVGADFTNAALARDGFLKNPQLNWQQFYTANTTPENLGKAAYVFYDDVVEDAQLTLTSIANINFTPKFSMDIGGSYRVFTSNNYAQITDLLGAEFHEDIDPFSETRNDTDGPIAKTEGDQFNYHYDITASEWNIFAQLEMNKMAWKGFVSGTASGISYQRIGRYRNERFLESAFGESEQLQFSDYGLKGGLSYRVTGRHWISANAGVIQRAPTLQNVFINPRENNAFVPNIQSESISTIDANYFIRLPDLTGRLTGFSTRFQNTTDVNFFFVDAGVGSDFVQEVLTDLDKLHMGIEMGLEYQVSPQVKLSLAGTLARYSYASNPKVTINFDTAGAEEDLIAPEGNLNLGNATIKDLKLAQGPQTAIALGVEYRDPNYWWVGATANYLADNYASISTITRTPSFILNPDTGLPFPEASPENVAALLQQTPLDNFYLLNLVGGKSWLLDGKYISLFVSINNAFDSVFRTGGFEQNRNGNFGQLQQDSRRDNPSFAPKYWFGFGRTYFLNLAISF
ncbi:MAG: TonB-dependent receptor [Bacteroidota bacterium]